MGNWRVTVISIHRQLHGYRRGHQLLAGSVQLSKDDQSTIDQLSDIAGPLRPRELFEPYLTGYSLPSGLHYVLARTWQDPTVNRAGCVRTISLIIPTEDWASAASLAPFLAMLALDRLPEEADATCKLLTLSSAGPLPPVVDFNGTELLEALFLEDSQPIVVFDTPNPELVATRLLSALWPSLRRQFALSTFALAPRRIGGREFNLVFAPKDARSKFSDWKGRRIDGHSSADARHRWTETLAARVFVFPHPRLLSVQDQELLADGGNAVHSASTLRIALLWDELLGKLRAMPTAALGLLDIANSGKMQESAALAVLEPFLIDAIDRAPSALPNVEAWDFLGAIIRKLHGRSAPKAIEAVDSAVAALTKAAPEGAIALLSQSDERTEKIFPIIANVIAASFTDRTRRLLISSPSAVLVNLISYSNQLVKLVADDISLIDHLGENITQLDASLIAVASNKLLPYLVFDWQLPAASPLINSLGREELAAEIKHLGATNDFAALKIATLCITRAREIGITREIMTALSSLGPTRNRDELLANALDPSLEDAYWLLKDSQLSPDVLTRIFAKLLSKANNQQLLAIMCDEKIGDDAVAIAERGASDILQRTIELDETPLDLFVKVVNVIFDSASLDEKFRISAIALQRCLGQHFGGDEIAFISLMLSGLGERLNGAWAAQSGIARDIRPSIASRNMVAFDKAPRSTRLTIERSIINVAQLLRQRRFFDLDNAAAEAFAQILSDAERTYPHEALAAAGHLLPMLLQQHNKPVALIISVAFPMLYKEFSKKDSKNELFQFIPFYGWDKCKAARQELVSSFMSSTWPPVYLALTACRCGDVKRILRRAARAYGGDIYIGRIDAELSKMPSDCRQSVKETIESIRMKWPSAYDPHD
jgi:hypothetical protein